MPYISLPDCNMFYETGGKGTPVVYIHGGFASLATILYHLQPNQWGWEHDFATQFHFVSYDRRGCYRSSCPQDGYDLMNQVHDLCLLLDHLQIADAHIIGSSAGGPIAILFAATQYHRIRSLTLVGTALTLFPNDDYGSNVVREHLTILERYGAETAFVQRPKAVEVTFGEIWDEPEAIARGVQDEHLERQRRWRAEAQELPIPQRIHHYAVELRSMQAYIALDIRPYAQSVKVPTYVIHGSNDQMVPLKDAQELAMAIPSAELDIIDGGPHSLMIRDPASRRRVMDFMHTVDLQLSAQMIP